ncbi:MAG: J domain-containing protein [Hyphomicrobiales bacterium]
MLGLTAGATAEAICARYRQLLKRHHPDTNGGSRDGENKLMAIIKAYNELKMAGIC